MLVSHPCFRGPLVLLAAVRNDLERTNDRISVPITQGEFSIMRSALKVSMWCRFG